MYRRTNDLGGVNVKNIFEYDESTATHLTMISVTDDHVLADDELETLPEGFLTPAKLVNGKIVSSTQAESDDFYSVKPVEVEPSAEQALAKQVMSLSTENDQLKKQLMQLSKSILGGKQNG